VADTKHDTAKIRRRVQALPFNLRIRAIAAAVWSCDASEGDELVGYLIEAAAPAAPGMAARVFGQLPGGVRAVFEGDGVSPRDLAIRALASVWQTVPARLRPLAAAAGASLPDRAQKSTSAAPSRFELAAPVVATSEDFRARRSVARLIADVGLRDSIALLGPLASDPEPSVRDAATASLMSLALEAAQLELDRLGLRSVLADEALVHARSALEAARVVPSLDAARESGAGVGHWSRPACDGVAVRLAAAISQALHAGSTGGSRLSRSSGSSGSSGTSGSSRSSGSNRVLMTAALLGASRGEPARLILRAARALEAGPISDDPTLSTLRSTLRLSNAPLAALRAVEWLSVPSLRRSASDRLAAPRSSLDVELALGASHLLLRPARSAGGEARPAARVQGRRADVSGRGGGAQLGNIGRLDVPARLGATRLVEWLDLAAPARDAAIAPLIADPQPAVRHALSRDVRGSLLTDMLFDSCEPVARHAFFRWSLAGTGLSRSGGVAAQAIAGQAGFDHATTLARLRRAPHASVRIFARDEHALGAAPAGLGDRLALRRALASNRAGAIGRLAGHLASADPARCEHTISLIRAVGLAPELAAELLALLERHRGSADAASRRLTASLASLLGELATSDASAAVGELIRHDDARVGANAVEALAKQARAIAGPENAAALGACVARLVELKADARHRVRANALRAMIESGTDQPSAIDALVSMLRDGRVGHRLASAWVLWRILPDMRRGGASRERDAAAGEGWPHLAASAARLASFDPDHRVRRRAAACVSRLSAVTGGAWSPAA